MPFTITTILNNNTQMYSILRLADIKAFVDSSETEDIKTVRAPLWWVIQKALSIATSSGNIKPSDVEMVVVEKGDTLNVR